MSEYQSVDVVLRWVGPVDDVHLTNADAACALAIIEDLTLRHNGTPESVPLRDGWAAVAISDGREISVDQLRQWAAADRHTASA